MGTSLVPFSELLSEVIDNRGRTCPTSGSGVPLIATNCIRNDFLYPSYETVRYVSPDTYQSWFRGHPRPGDLIFVLKGTPGRVCIAPDPVDFCIAQDMVALRADESKVDPKYLFALLRSPRIQSKIEQMHVGTLIPHFKKGDFNRLLLPVPNRLVQRFIGDVYFMMSSKIDLNSRMNETLEATARVVFKSWFVDFDPVRAKAAGRQPTGMSAAAAALFPHMMHNGVPTGWRTGTFSELALNQRAQVDPGDVPNDTAYIALEHMPRKSIALSEWGTLSGVASNKFRFATGDILFGKLRPYFHKVGVAPIDGVCSTDILVIRPQQEEFFGLVLGHAASEEMVGHADAGSTGTKMPRTSWDELGRYEITIPPITVARAFNDVVAPMIARIRSNIHESRTLAALRDTLLPKLLSGEVRLKQAEKMMETKL